MAVSARAEQIEAMLAKTPADPFLKYALAMEYLKAGSRETGIAKLRQLTIDSPEYHAAHHQLGIALASDGMIDDASAVLKQGIAAAAKSGDTHAMGEMETLLMSI